jgi:hypothetical protein
MSTFSLAHFADYFTLLKETEPRDCMLAEHCVYNHFLFLSFCFYREKKTISVNHWQCAVSTLWEYLKVRRHYKTVILLSYPLDKII